MRLFKRNARVQQRIEKAMQGARKAIGADLVERWRANRGIPSPEQWRQWGDEPSMPQWWANGLEEHAAEVCDDPDCWCHLEASAKVKRDWAKTLRMGIDTSMHVKPSVVKSWLEELEEPAAMRQPLWMWGDVTVQADIFKEHFDGHYDPRLLYARILWGAPL